MKYVFDPILPKEMIDAATKFFINPTMRLGIGGPNGDSGLTGRKIIVDTYGGYARYVAKNIVAVGLADKCEIQLSYAIGVA